MKAREVACLLHEATRQPVYAQLQGSANPCVMTVASEEILTKQVWFVQLCSAGDAAQSVECLACRFTLFLGECPVTQRVT
jgi:hypothetical protein